MTSTIFLPRPASEGWAVAQKAEQEMVQPQATAPEKEKCSVLSFLNHTDYCFPREKEGKKKHSGDVSDLDGA